MDALTYWWKRAKDAEAELEKYKKILENNSIEEALNKLPVIDNESSYKSKYKSPAPGRRKD